MKRQRPDCDLLASLGVSEEYILLPSELFSFFFFTLEVFVGGRRETLVSLAFCRGP